MKVILSKSLPGKDSGALCNLLPESTYSIEFEKYRLGRNMFEIDFLKLWTIYHDECEISIQKMPNIVDFKKIKEVITTTSDSIITLTFKFNDNVFDNFHIGQFNQAPIQQHLISLLLEDKEKIIELSDFLLEIHNQ